MLLQTEQTELGTWVYNTGINPARDSSVLLLYKIGHKTYIQQTPAVIIQKQTARKLKLG